LDGPALQPIAYLTCELKGRDLASRLLIASKLVARGYTVIVGQQWSIFSNIRACARGAVLFKTANATQGEWMCEARNCGHAVIASDQECLAVAPGPFMLAGTHPSAAESCNVYLANSASHAETIASAYPGAAHKVRVVGNARIDLLRQAKPSRPIPEPYILVNTVFGLINHLSGDVKQAVGLWIGSGDLPRNDETQRLVNERLSFEERALPETLELVEWIVANTKLKVVVRPHPAERAEYWLRRYAGRDRILVPPTSDPIPWMKHAEVVVHSESTTGLEAAVMGVRAINLSTAPEWRSRMIIQDVNVTVDSAVAASQVIEGLLHEDQWPAIKVEIDQLFPRGSADATAAAIAEFLPDPRSAGGSFTWHKIERTDMQRAKFSVSAAEVAAQVTCQVHEVDDSVFALRP
jgi:surface carbohydrate biosynthesis protein